MNPHDPDEARRRQALSELADGDATAEEAAVSCQAWRDDPRARQTWHAYHLIGDVLRSDALARPAAADAAFVARLRTRLAEEPAVLAPMPSPSADRPAAASRGIPNGRAGTLRWLMPTAVAAGFVAVGGVLVVARMQGPAAVDASGLQARASAPAGVPVAAIAAAAPASTAMIRSAELDAYLRAHQAARGGAAVAVPGGMLQGAGVQLPAEPAR
jgi:sigma-E factor negative regulatory protein RseA